MFSPSRLLFLALVGGLAPVLHAADLYVAPNGADANPGSSAKPLKSLVAAQKAARAFAGKEAVNVRLAPGTYYLAETLQFTSADSGSAAAPVTWVGDEKSVVISGGSLLALQWQPDHGGIFKAQTPAGLAIDQLYVNGKRQRMARFPNAIPGKNVFDVWDLKHGKAGGSADENPVGPQRIARWANPAGGYYHAMHSSLWGDMHWLIKGKNAEGNGLEIEGGWQNNRPASPHGQYRFVENIREELDAPGEWFHDAQTNTLFYYPEAGADLKTAKVEVVRLAHLIEFNGDKSKPVKFVKLKGLTFRHAARTFMLNKEPLLRSDWTVYRGGAVVFNGAEDCAIEDSTFDQVGGNTVFVNNYNRRIAVRGCLIKESGASGVVFVGDPKAVRNPIFRYGPQNYAKLDLTPGPVGDNFPADCVVEDCLITRTGRDEKQTAPVHVSMSLGITVRHCSIYDVPRAGININEGTFGGHLIEDCDVFDTVLETGDHGSFNSWGRDRYWDPKGGNMYKAVAENSALPLLDMVKPNTLRHNRWRCDHGWDVDLDDGSTNYIITQNLMLRGGLKLREGYKRIVTNNIIVNNSLHAHCWPPNSGDVIKNNIFMGAFRPASIDHKLKWGQEIDRNLFMNEADRTKFAKNGCDAQSLGGDPQFVDPAHGNYQVKPGSPALQLGFKNFSMEFGVRKPGLKTIAKTPVLPGGGVAATVGAVGARFDWQGALIRDMEGEEFSAVGVAQDAGGVFVAEVAEDSLAGRAGLQNGDFIQRLDGKPVRSAADFAKALSRGIQKGQIKLGIRRSQADSTMVLAAPIAAPVKK